MCTRSEGVCDISQSLKSVRERAKPRKNGHEIRGKILEKKGKIRANISPRHRYAPAQEVAGRGGVAAVHCGAGQGRTGTVLAGYIMRTRGVVVEEVNIITYQGLL